MLLNNEAKKFYTERKTSSLFSSDTKTSIHSVINANDGLSFSITESEKANTINLLKMVRKRQTIKQYITEYEFFNHDSMDRRQKIRNAFFKKWLKRLNYEMV